MERQSEYGSGGVFMVRSRKRKQLWQVARAGLTDMPGNAAWVLSRALRPATSAARDSSAASAAVLQNVSDTASAATESAHDARSSMSRRTTGASRKAKGAMRTMAEGIPGVGDDSVASLMRRADDAVEHAQQQEARAVSLAQEAKQAAEQAAAAARDSDRAVEQAKRDAERKIETRVKRARAAGDQRVASSIRDQEQRVGQARQDADEFVEAERRAEVTDSIKATEQAEAEASRRVRAKEREAERAQARAAEAIAEAERAQSLARGLADRASEAAEQAARQANVKPIGWRARLATAPGRPDGRPPRQISCGRKRMMRQVTADQRLGLAPRPASRLRTQETTSTFFRRTSCNGWLAISR